MEPLILRFGDILLRDRVPSDLENHRRWLSTETAWLDWDAPWEKNDPEINEKYLERLAMRLGQPLPSIRSTLEICLQTGPHLGLVNAYSFEGDPDRLAVGIGLRESAYWGRGYGRQAFFLWLAYHFAAGDRSRLYCQTWSGNIRMVKLAARAGFIELERQRNFREVRGRPYDALTLILFRDTFFAACPQLQPIIRQLQKGNGNE